MIINAFKDQNVTKGTQEHGEESCMTGLINKKNSTIQKSGSSRSYRMQHEIQQSIGQIQNCRQGKQKGGKKEISEIG